VKPFGALLVALALGLSILSACGGDDESDRDSGTVERAGTDQAQPSPSGPPLSRKEFASRTDGICDDLRVSITRLSDRYFSASAPTAEEMSNFAGEAAGALQEALARLRGLAAPTADKAEIAALIQAAEQGVSRLEQAAKGPEEAKKLLRGDPLARAQALARRSGLHACTTGR
jgi:hypothetical protein